MSEGAFASCERHGDGTLGIYIGDHGPMTRGEALMLAMVHLPAAIVEYDREAAKPVPSDEPERVNGQIKGQTTIDEMLARE